jgi:hypothetical protein
MNDYGPMIYYALMTRRAIVFDWSLWKFDPSPLFSEPVPSWSLEHVQRSLHAHGLDYAALSSASLGKGESLMKLARAEQSEVPLLEPSESARSGWFIVFFSEPELGAQFSML